MIISHQYKFIFFKTKKTAGTSIEIALSKYCGPVDIITPISPTDQDIRENLGYRGPQNYLKTFSQYNLKDWARLFVKGKRAKLFFNHMPAIKAKEMLGPAIWQSYFKFCFERNPWDKVVSLYKWESRKSKRQEAFSKFIERGRAEALRLKGGYDLYVINGTIAMDTVYLYENMTESLEKIAARLKLPEVPVLPQAKSAYRGLSDRDYRRFYDEKDKTIIERLFETEIRLFHYSF